MYGLKKAAHIAFANIIKLLSPHGYLPVQEYPGLWKHRTQPKVFTLCINAFCIKANSTEDAHHLINVIKNILNAQLTGKVKIILVQL